MQKLKLCRLPPKHHFFRGAGAGGRMWTSWSRHTHLGFLEDLRLDAGSRRFVGRFKTLCRPVPHPDPNFSDVTQMQFHLNTLLKKAWFSMIFLISCIAGVFGSFCRMPDSHHWSRHVDCWFFRQNLFAGRILGIGLQHFSFKKQWNWVVLLVFICTFFITNLIKKWFWNWPDTFADP